MTKSGNFPPVVSILGHVDHGKTTLLDAIRKTNVATREHGGITQTIGAYQVEVDADGKKQKITFIDTPGHEAFLKMRSRGALASDIALLIVASDDGVMPQTEESIRHIKEAGIPFLVVLTKADVQTADLKKVRSQLAKAGIALEGFGGDTPIISVSAKEGKGIQALLELILLVAQLNNITKDVTKPFSGVVIESKIDSHAGVLVSIIVKSGVLHVGDEVSCEDVLAKVRSLITDKGERVKEVFPGDPIEILGFPQIIPVGATVSLKEEPGLSVSSNLPAKEENIVPEKVVLSVILKADTQGSLEAILASLPQGLGIIEKGTGFINEGDVLLAKSAKAIIVGFNTKVKQEALRLAQTENVPIKTYTIIYELLDELGAVASELAGGNVRISGKAEVIGSFVIKNTKVLGARVIEGKMGRGGKVMLMRKDQEVGKSTIASLRQAKEDKPSVLEGQECGIVLSPSLDFSLGDMIISYS